MLPDSLPVVSESDDGRFTKFPPPQHQQPPGFANLPGGHFGGPPQQPWQPQQPGGGGGGYAAYQQAMQIGPGGPLGPGAPYGAPPHSGPPDSFPYDGGDQFGNTPPQMFGGAPGGYGAYGRS